MPAEDEERFQLSNSCWTCNKLVYVGDDKVGDHCHITGKYIEMQHTGVVILILNRVEKFL